METKQRKKQHYARWRARESRQNWYAALREALRGGVVPPEFLASPEWKAELALVIPMFSGPTMEEYDRVMLGLAKLGKMWQERFAELADR